MPAPPSSRSTSSGDLALGDLLRAGFDVTHVHGTTAQLLARPHDLARLAALGATVRVLDPSPGRTAAARARAELAARPAPASARVLSATGPDGVYRIQSLPPFGSGSMGGYWTAAEIKMKLDQLVANDTQNLVADKIDTVGWSREGRPVWGLKVAKAVGGTDTRPVVFFNALTHSREPGSMQAVFWFIDDVLAKYGTDPLATRILDQRALYIVPLVNPDGYAVNEAIYSGSGGSTFGLWRKNTRDNNNSGQFEPDSDGVDINRNYGYNWGLNDSGSSPTPTAETYRGPSAFSEPETQAQRDLVTALKPVTGFSFHSHGDLLLHPWGSTTTPTPDNAAFAEWSDLMSRDNAYASGATPNVLYDVNGDFNDWAYGDTLAKPRGFTWTPEIGTDVDNFWPPPSRIVPLAVEQVRPCYLVAAIAGAYVRGAGFDLVEGAMNAGRLTNLVVRARNLGAKSGTGAGLAGTMVALDAGAHVLNATVNYPAAGPRQTVDPAGERAVPGGTRRHRHPGAADALPGHVRRAGRLRHRHDRRPGRNADGARRRRVELRHPVVVDAVRLERRHQRRRAPERLLRAARTVELLPECQRPLRAARALRSLGRRARLRALRGEMGLRAGLRLGLDRSEPRQHRMDRAARHRHHAGQRHRVAASRPDCRSTPATAATGGTRSPTCRRSPVPARTRCGCASAGAPMAVCSETASRSTRCASSCSTRRHSRVRSRSRPAWRHAGSNSPARSRTPRAASRASSSICRAPVRCGSRSSTSRAAASARSPRDPSPRDATCAAGTAATMPAACWRRACTSRGSHPETVSPCAAPSCSSNRGRYGTGLNDAFGFPSSHGR